MTERPTASRIIFTHLGWEDYRSWRASDPTTFEELTELIHWLASEDPTSDTDSTRLALDQQVIWSRRVCGKHRLVYTRHDRDLVVLQALYHDG